MITTLRVLLSRIRGAFQKRRSEAALREEIEAHLEMLVEENMRRGMAEEDARVAARCAFGGVEQVKELYREQRGLPLVDALRQDFGFATRILIKDRWVTSVVVLVMALGIGVNTAMFSIAESLLLRPLPVHEPDRLIHVNYDESSGENFWATVPAWEEIHRRRLFEGSMGWASERLEITRAGQSEPAEAIWVSSDFFDVLGVPTTLGRTPQRTNPTADTLDAFDIGDIGAEAMISHRYWQTQFGADPNVLGTAVWIERVPFAIVGVSAPQFFGPNVGRHFDIALPLASMPRLPGRADNLRSPKTRVRILARLKEGQSVEEATFALQHAQDQVREATVPHTWRRVDRENYLSEPLTAVPAQTGVSSVRSRYEDPLIVLVVVAGLVLLIACGNIATVLLARASGRSRELGIRIALGASRARLIRQLFAESVVLSLAACTVGLLLGHWSSTLLLAQMSTVLETIFVDVSLNERVLTFMALMGTATAVLVGIAPALRASGVAPVDALSGGAKSSTAGSRFRPFSALTVAQIAISLVLAVAAGLFLGSFTELASVSLGLEPRKLLVADIDASGSLVEPADMPKPVEQACGEARSIPEASTVGCSLAIPIGFRAGMTVIDVPEQPLLSEQERWVHKNAVSIDWFETFGTNLLAGRAFGPFDRVGAPLVAVVNESFAQRFLAEGEVIGATIREDRRDQGVAELTVVGLAQDAVYRSIREPVPPTVYLPLSQADRLWPFFNVAVRTRAQPEDLSQRLRNQLRRVSPKLKMNVRWLDEQIEATYNHERVLAMLSGALGGLGLLLAALGLFGVTAYAVSRRRREIGIRMALGANPSRVRRMILRGTVTTLGLGLVIGTAISIWAGHLVQSLLFEVTPVEPRILTAAAALLVFAATLASWLPLRRAGRIAPAEIMRDD